MAKYLAIKTNDIDNGPGLRVSVWFSGCPHECNGCHNKECWNKELGKEFTDETINKIIEFLDGDIKQDLSILGGEPLAPYNIQSCIKLINEVRKRLPNTKIWLWTGYDIEEVVFLEPTYGDIKADVIVDGKYIKSLHINDKYRGSSNQRVIKHLESIDCGNIVLYTE